MGQLVLPFHYPPSEFQGNWPKGSNFMGPKLKCPSHPICRWKKGLNPKKEEREQKEPTMLEALSGLAWLVLAGSVFPRPLLWEIWRSKEKAKLDYKHLNKKQGVFFRLWCCHGFSSCLRILDLFNHSGKSQQQDQIVILCMLLAWEFWGAHP